MAENPFERKTDGVGELPTVEQIEEFRTLMTDIMHSLGRGVRLGRMDEITRTRIGTEYFLPGAYTDLTTITREGRLYDRTERETRISASLSPALGERAERLLILSTHIQYMSDIDAYNSRRGMYKIDYDVVPIGVFRSQVLPIESVSDARTDGEIVSGGKKTLLTLDHERTVEGGDPDRSSGYHSDINPFRTTDDPWETVTREDFAALIARTEQFGRDRLADKK